MTDAHDQTVTHRYLIHYPEHDPRKGDPHYIDFEAYRRRTKATAKCSVGAHRNDFSECKGPLELHHSHIEFALANGVDFKWLDIDYPGISNPDQVGVWINSGSNLDWLCQFHHRGSGGVHNVSAADFEAERYVRGLIDSVNGGDDSGRGKGTTDQGTREDPDTGSAGQAQPGA